MSSELSPAAAKRKIKNTRIWFGTAAAACEWVRSEGDLEWGHSPPAIVCRSFSPKRDSERRHWMDVWMDERYFKWNALPLFWPCPVPLVTVLVVYQRPCCWNCHKVTISKCVPSAKGSLVISIPVSSKFPFVPALILSLVSASVTLFVTWFTTICKLAPSLFNVRLVDMKMSDLAISHKRRWRNPGEGTKAWLLGIDTGPDCCTMSYMWTSVRLKYHMLSSLSTAEDKEPVLTAKQRSAGPGTAITQIMWAVSPAWRLESASGRPISLVSTDPWWWCLYSLTLR